MMDLVGTILVGPNEEMLETALDSFNRCNVDAIHALIDNKRIDDKSMQILERYGCKIFNKEWEWNFGMSRTYIGSTVPDGTKYELFLDCDDEVPETSAKIVRDISLGDKVGFIRCPYIYTEGNQSFSCSRVRMYPPKVKWTGRCHEVPILPPNMVVYDVPDLLIYHHYKGNESGREDRYIDGLLKDLEEGIGGSRTLHYLGQSYFAKGDIDNAIKYYTLYLDNRDKWAWADERMKACIYLTYCYQQLGDTNMAIQYADMASSEMGNSRREPFVRLSELYYNIGRDDEALRYIDQALSFPVPSLNVGINIAPYSYPAIPYFLKAEIEKRMGRHRDAYNSLQNGLSLNPLHEWALNVKQQYEKDADKGMSCIDTPPNRLIYMHLGKAPQPWVASDINNRGIGGRETATVHLAQELKKYGWEPVIFGDCEGMEGIYEGLEHIDYRKFADICRVNKPQFIMASAYCNIVDDDLPVDSIKILWTHDAGYGDEKNWNYLSPERRDKWDAFVFGCESHLATNKEWYNLPDEKCKIINLGIYLDRFEKSAVRDRHKIVYTSSPDRGLERLLSYWNEIKNFCPEATLHIYYGFDNMKAYGISPEWVENIYKTMANLDGIRFHGRIPQNQLADELLGASIWAYPTHFWETTCISALEASAAGLALVTTDYGALHTTVANHGILINKDVNSKEYDEEFIGHVKHLLNDDDYWLRWSNLAKSNITSRRNDKGDLLWKWESVGKIWNDYLYQLLGHNIPIIEGNRFDYIKSLCNPSEKIIDIGCGGGEVFDGWDRRNITSVDVDKYNIPNFHHADASDLPFKDKYFEVAVLGEILEHVEDPVKVIQEACRVANRVIITVPYEYKWTSDLLPFSSLESEMQRTGKSALELANEKQPTALEFCADVKHLYHIRYYTPNMLQIHIKDAGYSGDIKELHFGNWVWLTALLIPVS